MWLTRYIILIFLGLCVFYSNLYAGKGFSIEGGLLYDRPASGSHNRPYPGMKGGLGYTANLGYDFFNRVGMELGIIHSTHKYNLEELAGGVIEDNADKTTFFVKVRFIPLKYEKFEFVTSAGVGFSDISGRQRVRGNDLSNNFSGKGLTFNLDLRYYITPGLGVSLYLGGNLVNYTDYEIEGNRQDYRSYYETSLPGGNSLNWGLTLYHYIGIPQL